MRMPSQSPFPASYYRQTSIEIIAFTLSHVALSVLIKNELSNIKKSTLEDGGLRNCRLALLL